MLAGQQPSLSVASSSGSPGTASSSGACAHARVRAVHGPYLSWTVPVVRGPERPLGWLTGREAAGEEMWAQAREQEVPAVVREPGVGLRQVPLPVAEEQVREEEGRVRVVMWEEMGAVWAAGEGARVQRVISFPALSAATTALHPCPRRIVPVAA